MLLENCEHKTCCWKIPKKFTNWSSSLDIRRSQYQQYAHPGLGFPSLKHKRHVWEYLPKGFPQQLCFTSSLPIFGFQKSKLYHLNGQCHRIWHFPPSVHRRETWVWKINICSNPTLFIFFDLPDMKVSRSTVKMWLSFPRTQDTDLLFRLNTFDNRFRRIAEQEKGSGSPRKRDTPPRPPVRWKLNQCWDWRRDRWARGSRGCCPWTWWGWWSFPSREAGAGWGKQTTSLEGPSSHWFTSHCRPPAM